MKKFLLLLIIGIVIQSNLFAQSFELMKKDGSAIINDTILISTTNIETTLEVPVYVKNLTDANLDIMVKKYDLDLVSGSDAYFCWDRCYPNTTYISAVFLTAEANDTIKDFSGDFKPNGNNGLSKIMYTFFKNKTTNDSVSVTIYYDIVTVGINNFELIKSSISSFPNPVNDFLNFNYSLGRNSQGEIYIYDIVGKRVKHKQITNSENHSQINVSDLNPGIYIWTIQVDGIPIKSEKLIKR
ncbi:MAG: T9SS type A sorting domain-containing protein [Bacteroidales bacterium]|nr:T9SS type A sorting domain-containing protein [Bacteroidales bacterium]